MDVSKSSFGATKCFTADTNDLDLIQISNFIDGLIVSGKFKIVVLDVFVLLVRVSNRAYADNTSSNAVLVLFGHCVRMPKLYSSNILVSLQVIELLPIIDLFHLECCVTCRQNPLVTIYQAKLFGCRIVRKCKTRYLFIVKSFHVGQYLRLNFIILIFEGSTKLTKFVRCVIYART